MATYSKSPMGGGLSQGRGKGGRMSGNLSPMGRGPLGPLQPGRPTGPIDPRQLPGRGGGREIRGIYPSRPGNGNPGPLPPGMGSPIPQRPGGIRPGMGIPGGPGGVEGRPISGNLQGGLGPLPTPRGGGLGSLPGGRGGNYLGNLPGGRSPIPRNGGFPGWDGGRMPTVPGGIGRGGDLGGGLQPILGGRIPGYQPGMVRPPINRLGGSPYAKSPNLLAEMARRRLGG